MVFVVAVARRRQMQPRMVGGGVPAGELIAFGEHHVVHARSRAFEQSSGPYVARVRHSRSQETQGGSHANPAKDVPVGRKWGVHRKGAFQTQEQ